MMNETLYIILAFVAGVGLGVLFFGGLWFTLRKKLATPIPSLWVISSFLIRVAIVLSGFYFISQGSWVRFIICILGFIAARFIVTYLTKTYE